MNISQINHVNDETLSTERMIPSVTNIPPGDVSNRVMNDPVLG